MLAIELETEHRERLITFYRGEDRVTGRLYSVEHNEKYGDVEIEYFDINGDIRRSILNRGEDVEISEYTFLSAIGARSIQYADDQEVIAAVWDFVRDIEDEEWLDDNILALNDWVIKRNSRLMTMRNHDYQFLFGEG